MSDRAEIVVVGGGVQGALLALHLIDAGVTDVRLVDRDGMFQATSAAAAGFLAYWAIEIPEFGHEEVAIEQYGLDYYRGLHESGYDIDFLQNGLLILTDSDRLWPEVERFAMSGWDLPAVVVDGEQISDLTAGVVELIPTLRGVWHPPGAQLFAPKLGKALTERLVQRGVSIDERRPVTDLMLAGGRIAGVMTAAGPIHTDTVILATGAWTNQLLASAGIFLPMVPFVTSRIITEPLALPGSLPALFLEGLTNESHGEHVWARNQGGSLLFGGSYRSYPRDTFIDASIPARLDDIPIDGVLAVQALAARASRYMPVFEQYRSITVKHGVPCYTPDYRAFVGPVSSISGLYVMTGDCECGVTHGPGFAKALADHIVKGVSDLTPLDAWRTDRFAGRYGTSREVAEAVDELHRKRLAASAPGLGGSQGTRVHA